MRVRAQDEVQSLMADGRKVDKDARTSWGETKDEGQSEFSERVLSSSSTSRWLRFDAFYMKPIFGGRPSSIGAPFSPPLSVPPP